MKSRKLKHLIWMMAIAVLLVPDADAQRKKAKDTPESDSLKSSTFGGLKWRSIGPAMTSGRIADFAVNEENPKEYYVAVAAGHVWKTVNAGVSWQPIFDDNGAYAMGCITLDPNNPHVVWVGTGENNHQRALGYGNGVWKSMDGGESFKNMGLKESRQIGGIVIDPRNSDIVFVAAEGSVWGPGGERGLYKSTDGGENWKKVLEISEHTGINNVVMDPERPDIMYATSEQRRRHVFSKIGGGPESAVYKSTDGGETWRKIMKGLPEVHIGGMGIAVSPADPDVVYLIMEAGDGKGGFFRSTNLGESWSRMSDHHSSGQYYNEIYADPENVDLVYSMETYTQISLDGGKTWKNLGNDKRHVDDHALWIDPEDTEHLLIGGDGGIYESWDRGKLWDYKQNLPVTQFYRVMVDNEEPFYNVYGGTQDNNTLAGPSRNTSSLGVTNEEWRELLGGDGFWVATDPEDPNIVYCEYQYGNVYRVDRQSMEQLLIKPRPAKGEKTYKWNWDAPMLMSPHSNTRLYMAANFVFRSDDRGESWTRISDDITAGIDRNTWPVMDHFWSIDAVQKDVSTSLFGMGVAMVESPVKEDLLYVGTDDGVISVTPDAGDSWSQTKTFPGVPANTYVSDILADRFDENVVYACFNNHKRDDFKPYILRSSDQGKTWTSIAGNLPENGSVWTIEQDYTNPDLLFAGTEFGFHFSVDGGKEWVALESGLPDVAVRDITLQQRENDLVIATFGRGFYILDDYHPLRVFKKDILEKEAHLFPVREAKMFIVTDGKYGQGSNFFAAKNPEFGAGITYYLKDVPKTLKEIRKEKEKELFKEKKPIPQPSVETLRAEAAELAPYLVFSIRDETGHEIRGLTAKPAKGIQRVMWDLKYPSAWTVDSDLKEFDPYKKETRIMLAMPGKYTVSLSIVTSEGVKELAGPVEFSCRTLNNRTLPAEDHAKLVNYQKEVTRLGSAMDAAEDFTVDMQKKLKLIRQTLLKTPAAPSALDAAAMSLEKRLKDILFTFNGAEAKASWEELPPAEVPLNQRLSVLVYSHWSSTSGVTMTEWDNLEILKEEFPPVLETLKEIHADLMSLNEKMDEIGAPWTPGRIPQWK